jgi:hypothetical protein
MHLPCPAHDPQFIITSSMSKALDNVPKKPTVILDNATNTKINLVGRTYLKCTEAKLRKKICVLGETLASTHSTKVRSDFANAVLRSMSMFISFPT